jgi:hypothetical protein
MIMPSIELCRMMPANASGRIGKRSSALRGIDGFARHSPVPQSVFRNCSNLSLGRYLPTALRFIGATLDSAASFKAK